MLIDPKRGRQEKAGPGLELPGPQGREALHGTSGGLHEQAAERKQGLLLVEREKGLGLRQPISVIVRRPSVFPDNQVED